MVLSRVVSALLLDAPHSRRRGASDLMSVSRWFRLLCWSCLLLISLFDRSLLLIGILSAISVMRLFFRRSFEFPSDYSDGWI